MAAWSFSRYAQSPEGMPDECYITSFRMASHDLVSWEAMRIKGADRGIYVEDHRPQGNISLISSYQKALNSTRLLTEGSKQHALTDRL